MTATIDDVPNEVLVRIFDHLPCVVVLGHVAGVSRRWRAVSEDETAVGSCCREVVRSMRASTRSSVVGSVYYGGELYDSAAARGHLCCLRHLHGARVKHSTVRLHDITTIAAREGHLACLRFLHENGYRWTSKTTYAAIAHKRIDCLLYLIEHGCPGATQKCLALAQHAPLDCAECISVVEEDRSSPYSAAAHRGHVRCVRALHLAGYPWTESACNAAAEGGHLECLEYMVENGCPMDDYVCAGAAWKGSIPCLEYAHAKGCPWNAYTCKNAAESGNLDVLRHLHERGCPWDETTTTFAASNGRIACLRYAVANGCPVDKRRCWEQIAWKDRYGYTGARCRRRECHDRQMCTCSAERAECRNYIESLP
jgi:hypothetical protein